MKNMMVILSGAKNLLFASGRENKQVLQPNNKRRASE